MTVDVDDKFWYGLKSEKTKADEIMAQYKSEVQEKTSTTTKVEEQHRSEIA